ncbi:J domain-containing protein (plasmid) [Klebsiella pneumoniae]
MRTHYDNLKVSKDAPVEVIQAAYRTLAKKYHPDINKNNPEAVRIMQIINASYEVLINPLALLNKSNFC